MKVTHGTDFPASAKPRLGCFGLSFLTALCIVAHGSANADSASLPSASPSVGLTYQVLLPNGNPRIYLDKEGPTYWHDGLPIAAGDRIQVRADVAGGTQPMTRLQAKIDHAPDIASSTSPWIIIIDTKTISLGSHTLEVQAKLGGGKIRLAKRSDSFTLVQTLPDVTPTGSHIVTAVKGAEQVLSQGSVTTVSLPSDQVKPPSLLSAGQPDGNALVSLDFQKIGDQSLLTEQPIVLDQPVTVRVRPQFASSARTYVFSLARDGVVFYTSSTLLDASTTRIRLQPKTQDQEGLLPGTVRLYVWGIDDSGNYGPASEMTLDVRHSGSASSGEH